MPLANTSRAQVRYVAESAFGVIPVTTPLKLRMTGEGLDYNVQTESSKEIRSDRQKSDLVVVDAGAQGPINVELSYVEYDPLVEATLMGTWVKYGTLGVGTAFSGTFTASTITAAVAPTGGSAFTTLAQGQWFQLNAPTHANDKLYFRVHASTPPTTTVITVDPATPLTTGAGVASCSVATSRIANGVTERSFTVEREFADIAQFFAFRGMTAGKMSFNFQSGQIVNGSFDFMGKDTVRASATQLSGGGTASQVYDVMNAVSGVGHIFEGGTALAGTFIKSVSLGIDNKLRGRKAIGTLGNVSIGNGTIELMGQMEVYLADGSLYDKFVNQTASSLQFHVQDPAKNGYVFQLPRVKYKDAKVSAGSIDQDAMLQVPFEALMDPVSGKTIFIDRVGVAG